MLSCLYFALRLWFRFVFFGHGSRLISGRGGGGSNDAPVCVYLNSNYKGGRYRNHWTNKVRKGQHATRNDYKLIFDKKEKWKSFILELPRL